MGALFSDSSAFSPLAVPLPNALATEAENITLAQITSADWSLMLDSTAVQLGLATGVGGVVQGLADVGQCIMVILTTPKGSDPLRPTFGCDLWQFIDVPLTQATPHIVREVTEALTIWEPRLKVVAVTAMLAPNGTNSQYGANLVVSVTWQLQLGVKIQPAALQNNTTFVTITAELG